MIADLSGSFNREAGVGVRNLSSVESLVLRNGNTLGADSNELLDYFASSIYLRVFGEWENFLEQSALLAMAGRVPQLMVPKYVALSPAASLTEAHDALFGQNEYLLWHNPETVLRRLKRHFSSSPIISLVSANLEDLEWYAAIRHAIAHRSADANQRFQAKARSRARGFQYGPGRVLRSGGLQSGANWMNLIIDHLGRIANTAWPA